MPLEFVRHHGYPVPAVEELSGDGLDLVLERIDGLTMVEELRRRPWTVRRQGVALSELHRRLHQIPAPPFLASAPVGEGDRVLHLDLHPLNVMVGPRGPVVIDWANAAAGDAAVDVALAWVLIRAGQLPDWQLAARARGRAPVGRARGFLHGVDRSAVKAVAPAVVEWKARPAPLRPRTTRHAPGVDETLTLPHPRARRLSAAPDPHGSGGGIAEPPRPPPGRAGAGGPTREARGHGGHAAPGARLRR